MNNSVITRKNSLLFLIALVFSFCVANTSFSQEFERKKITEDMKCYESTQSAPTLSEGKTGKSILIRLGRTHFDPLQKLPAQKAGINSILAFGEGETGYYIIQFDGPIRSSWKTALMDTGAEIFDYVPDFAFIIRSASIKEQSVRALPHVRWLGIYQPSYRISQGALDKTFVQGQALEENEEAWELLRINIFPGEDLDRIKSEIDALGGMIMDEVTTKWKTTLKVKAPSTSIANLPAISGVKWIEPVPVWKLFNNISSDIMNVRTPRDTYGLYGEGQTVGVCDSGLDQGSANPASLHNDFENGAGATRVTQLIDLSGDGAQDAFSGHGTHVAGSVLGNGSHSGSNPSINSFPSTCFAGIAPKANLVFQATANNAGSLVGIPSDLNTLFSQSDVAGADLHTNSWGSSLSGMYTSSSQDVDEYMWDYKDFLVLFSAGNSGIDMDGNGVIDLYSMGSPATAKNCLTVGASEGNRPSGAGYDTPWATGSWAVKYSVAPINSDHVSDDPDGMAAFSSRGPVLDGRYKPDIVAPGTNILSTRSSVASGTLWGIYDTLYLWSGGTSMSTPLVAGAAALMRDYLINVKGHINPSAALIKSALLNSAEDITPGQYGTGATREIPNAPVPNNVEGWGRLNLGDGIYPSSPFDILYYDEQNSLNTGEYKEYSINVSDAGAPLKINLVWTDYPGSPATQGGLVNDLDLQVTDPSSTVRYPDHASQKSAVSTIAYDDDDPEYTYTANRLAVKFAPSSYPANVESTSFFFDNPFDTTTDVDVVVYDDGAGGLPGTELFSKTLTYVPTGWITVGITGVVINSGEFYIAIEKNDTNQRLWQNWPDSTGRSYHDTGSGWTVDTDYMTCIRANVRGTDHSTSFDRVNNVLGLTLDSPANGNYTIRVSGYNVPQGPQPYALVISGNVSVAGPGDELAVDFGSSGLYHYDDGTWAFLTGSNPEDMVAVARDLYVDFGGSGLYKYDGIWTFLTGSNSEDMLAVGTDLYVDFGTSGLYKYDGTWTWLTGSNSEDMVAVGTDLYVDFGTSGLFKYDGTWTWLTGSNSEDMVAVGMDLYVDFGTSGLYKYDGAWTFITGANAEDVVAVGTDLYVDFGASGLYKYDGIWTFLTGNSEDMVAVGTDLYVDFGTSGLYKYDGTWTFLTGANAEDMVAVGTDLYVDFGASGLYKYDGTWSFLTGANAEDMVAVDLY
jgi:Subtilase family